MINSISIIKKPRRILITGATSGIGLQAALNMLKSRHNVIIPCRNQIKVNKTIEKLSKVLPLDLDLTKSAEFPILDLADLKSLKSFVEVQIRRGSYIDSLVLNAGMQYTGSSEPRWSKQGFELTFATNHLSHQYLTKGLLPLLQKSQSPRIVITASEVHNPLSPGGRIGKAASLGELNGLKQGRGFEMLDGDDHFNADKAYKDSKLCNILFGRELFRRLKQSGNPFPVIAWAPGLVIPRDKGGFFRYSRSYNELGQIVFAFIARDLLHITETANNAGILLKKLATDTQYDKDEFVYWSNRLRGFGQMQFEQMDTSKESYNDDLAYNLWKLTDTLMDEYNSI